MTYGKRTSKSQMEKNTFSLDDIDCVWTLRASSLATLDAICCMACCCGCGGCCGRFNPFIIHAVQLIPEEDSINPGIERCQMTCIVQSIAGVVVPCTFCLCFFCCCGIATPCAKGVVECITSVENTNTKIHPVETVQMTR